MYNITYMLNTIAITALLEQIAHKGREQGLSQTEISTAAGLSKEALTRAKSRTNIGLENFSSLAQVVGLKLVLVADDPVIEKIESTGLFER